MLVPNCDPIVYTVALEMVKEAYANVGQPDVFKPDNVFFVSDNQFAYAAAVDGIMVREKPSANLNFFIGMFWAESLILTETGATTGAIQIAGKDVVSNIRLWQTYYKTYFLIRSYLSGRQSLRSAFSVALTINGERFTVTVSGFNPR